MTGRNLLISLAALLIAGWLGWTGSGLAALVWLAWLAAMLRLYLNRRHAAPSPVVDALAVLGIGLVLVAVILRLSVHGGHQMLGLVQIAGMVIVGSVVYGRLPTASARSMMERPAAATIMAALVVGIMLTPAGGYGRRPLGERAPWAATGRNGDFVTDR
jgi:hypothetical protein